MTTISITINRKNNTIELNKATAKAAAKFGSEAYKQLQDDRKDYPTFRVVTVAKKTAKPEYKGLTYEYMKKYIALHDDDNKTIMGKFLDLRGKSEAAEANGALSAGYIEIKAWFFQQYPAIQKFHEDRIALLKDAVDKQAAKKDAVAKQAAKKAA